MPRFVVERTFPEGLAIPMTDEGAAGCQRIIAINAHEGVTWVHSYVSKDKTKTYCVYDAPNEDAIRSVARKANLPVESIMEVSALDPYFYH